MSRAEELIADLEAEIVKRDARIEALLADSKALARNLKGKHAITGATYEHLSSRCDRLQAELEQQRGECVAVPRWETIHSALRNYGMSTATDNDGGAYPLIDAMSVCSDDVSSGISECEYLADAIYNAILAQQGKAVGE